MKTKDRKSSLLQRNVTALLLTVLTAGVLLYTVPGYVQAKGKAEQPAAVFAAGTDWTIDDDGMLTITSDKGMEDWVENRKDFRYYVMELVIENGVTFIEDYAFEDCRNLKQLTISDSVTSIGHSAFEDCRNLRQVTIPDSVTSIGSLAFLDCHNLREATISDGVTSIESGIFGGCVELKKIMMSDNVTSIGSGAFADCHKLKEVLIPDSVTSIGDRAFFHCLRLKEAVIPEGVTNIGKSTFAGCDRLKRVTIPERVTRIGESAFWACEALTEIAIPNGVTSIEEYAFARCYRLEKITVPASVTSIGDGAFQCGDRLEQVTMEGDAPPECGSDLFSKRYGLKIYVPEGTSDAYKDIWKEYAVCIIEHTHDYNYALVQVEPDEMNLQKECECGDRIDIDNFTGDGSMIAVLTGDATAKHQKDPNHIEDTVQTDKSNTPPKSYTLPVMLIALSGCIIARWLLQEKKY